MIFMICGCYVAPATLSKTYSRRSQCLVHQPYANFDVHSSSELDWRAYKGKLIHAVPITASLEANFISAKKAERSRHTCKNILENDFKEPQLHAIGKWLYLMHCYPTSWVPKIVLSFLSSCTHSLLSSSFCKSKLPWLLEDRSNAAANKVRDGVSLVVKKMFGNSPADEYHINKLVREFLRRDSGLHDILKEPTHIDQLAFSAYSGLILKEYLK